MLIRSPVGRNSVTPPSVPGARWFRRRMLAKVPRVMTRSFPRREPKELNCARGTPCATSHRPAGPSSGMSPAGLMWSVVTESARTARQRAPRIAARGAGSLVTAVRNGGSWM